MKKKALNEPLEIEFEVRGEEVIFTAGGEARFKAKADNLIRLFAPGFLTRPPAENEKPDALAGLYSLPAFVKMERLLKQGFSSDESARIMKIEPGLFRAALGRGIQKFARDVQLVNDETARQAKDEGDYCLRRLGPRTEGQRIRAGGLEVEYLMVPAARVRDLLRAGQGPDALARTLELDPEAFGHWITAHAELLA
jgi:hypothetical protein